MKMRHKKFRNHRNECVREEYLKNNSEYRTLNDLKPGEEGIIIKIFGRGPLKRRLMDMGVTCGAKIKVRKLAPLGDPIEVNVLGYELTIRKEEAKKIIIK
jgi:ferrous iron transport protein A